VALTSRHGEDRRAAARPEVREPDLQIIERSTVAIPAPHVILHANEDHGTEVHEN
jgi:hypothetical protein